MKGWPPLPEDNHSNLWEGESGMMEHCTRAFPMPVRGEVKSGATVWSPNQNRTLTESLGVKGNSATDNGEDLVSPPLVATAASLEKVAPERQGVISVSDEEDSDVQVVSCSSSSDAIKTSDTSSVILVEGDSPSAPRPKKKKKKKKKKGKILSVPEVCLG
ncbi:hypothetical protein ElyMa_000821500 [Elysia marginata]|uniref:Uncharacterized protein n=1 Tax=Elysia marginata TaxID=1093978 RepID=A0AAV4H060_9GAST|nr:hypothetical protein ElyMa_000821500 [Elysia marginata]